MYESDSLFLSITRASAYISTTVSDRRAQQCPGWKPLLPTVRNPHFKQKKMWAEGRAGMQAYQHLQVLGQEERWERWER